MRSFANRLHDSGKLWSLRVALALAHALMALPCHAQDIEPRRWSHLPIGGNFLGGAYASTTGDIFLDPVLQIEDAQFELQTAAAKYIRSFELLGKSARIDLIQAYQSGHWSGILNGRPAAVERDGWSDTTLRFAVNLLGAPPLSGKEFTDYRAKVESETIVGMGLAVQLPTGEYFEDKLINLGSNRFTLRPQMGLVQNQGKWTMELTAAAWLFTDNGKFFNGKQLEQDPVYTVDGNLIYSFRPGLWVSASAGYGGGGESAINGTPGNNRQNNLAWGLGLGVPISRALGLKFAYIASRTHASTGFDSDTLSCGFSVMW